MDLTFYPAGRSLKHGTRLPETITSAIFTELHQFLRNTYGKLTRFSGMMLPETYSLLNVNRAIGLKGEAMKVFLKTVLLAASLAVAVPALAETSVEDTLNQVNDAIEQGDFQAAKRLVEPLAEKGNADAQLALGSLYSEGNGVKQDFAAAKGWYEKAVAQNHAVAEYNLGVMYAAGQGVKQDYAKAMELWQKSAEQNYAPAQFNVGVLYYQGAGVKQDNAKAKSWWDKAVAQDFEPAKNALKELAEKK